MSRRARYLLREVSFDSQCINQISGGLREGSEATVSDKKGKVIGKGVIKMIGTKEELEEGRKKRRREKVFEIVERLEKGTPFHEKLLL